MRGQNLLTSQARSVIVLCTARLPPPRVALRLNHTVVELARRPETSTAPSARIRANRASFHDAGTEGKMAMGRERQSKLILMEILGIYLEFYIA